MLNSKHNTAKIEVGSDSWVLDVVRVCMVPDMVVVFWEICRERFALVYIYMTIYVVNNIIVLLRDVFHIGLVIGPRPAVLA